MKLFGLDVQNLFKFLKCEEFPYREFQRERRARSSLARWALLAETTAWMEASRAGVAIDAAPKLPTVPVVTVAMTEPPTKPRLPLVDSTRRFATSLAVMPPRVAETPLATAAPAPDSAVRVPATAAAPAAPVCARARQLGREWAEHFTPSTGAPVLDMCTAAFLVSDLTEGNDLATLAHFAMLAAEERQREIGHSSRPRRALLIDLEREVGFIDESVEAAVAAA